MIDAIRFAVFFASCLSACAPVSAPVAAEPPAVPAPTASAVDAPTPVAEETPTVEESPVVVVGQESVDPAILEAEALQACQRAAERLDAGDREGAIEAIDDAYGLMLQMPGPFADDQGSDDVGDAGQAKQDIRLLLASLIARAYGAKPETETSLVARSDLGLPMVDNEHVQREIKSFTTWEKEHFFAGYKRSGRYRPMILEKLEEAGLPSQLSWLPLVESSFKVAALSRASALGLWQFISSTGLRYGLERDTYVDERLDPEKATDAAIAYLTDLHRLFGDWPKALAAYNCGEGRVARLQKRSEGQFMDFWDLYNLLPDETRRYVPRLIAVIQLIENPEKYGITLPEPDPPMLTTVSVEVSKVVKLESLDAALKLEPGTIASLNPELRTTATPKRAYALRVPETVADQVGSAVAALPEYVPPQPKYIVHRVRSGETLSAIAERYRTSVSAIMRWNQIRSANRIWPGQRLRIPVRS